LADALDTPTLEGKFKLCQTRTDANRVLKRLQREAEDNLLAKQLGESFYIDKHQILLGDCRELLTKLEADSYDLCITDPPYGINAHKFGISGGTMAGFQHNYDDSPEYWAELMPEVLEQLSRVMKPESHLYIACDICKFETLKEILKQVKSKVWQIQRTPLIEVKSFGRVAVIDFYYRRLYECWLYARTGSKNSKAILDDVISKNKAPLEGHHAAVKGEKAYRTFLQTSGEVGGTFIDPFAGSGSILPFIHEWGMTYLGIENDETTYGQCCKQLQLLQEN
jgi:DNA modification methylase